MHMKRIFPSFPFHVEFELISACNLDCIYCYAQPFNRHAPSQEELGKLFHKTKMEADPFEVLLAGGEPFARADIVDIIELAKNVFKNVVAISTNGTLIQKLSRSDLGRLKASVDDGLVIQISLDSVNPEVNERTRGKTKETLGGLDILERNEIPFAINAVVTTSNKEDIVKTADYLISTYKQIRSFGVHPLYPTIKSVTNGTYSKLDIGSEAFRDVSASIDRLNLKGGRKSASLAIEDNRNSGYAKTLMDSYNIRTCTAGLIQAGVFVNGDVTPCLNLRNTILGNLYYESWREIWAKSIKRFCGLNLNNEQCHMLERQPNAR